MCHFEDKTVRRIGSTNGLVRSKRSTHPSPDLKTLWSPWSEWSECECGRQKRKRVCLKQIRVASNGSAEQTFYPIEKSTGPPIEFPEPAPFPSLMSRNRIRRSNKCPAPQIESRACFSIKSCID
ncbi:unnamed protein product [Caenorhabditis auriculariae]|uniref:Uncharacterized protein n=1 Tax=Caenorhabditis auriculariae TaxID=2777116 RepID=A0A8S1HAF6_9PELO|nr:unnamed protein product [Caenorhabditis auriculariae]